MTNNVLLTGFLFRQIFIVVLFISKYFTATVFTVGEKAMFSQTHNQTAEIKEPIHIILTFFLRSDSCVRILLWVWELQNQCTKCRNPHNFSNISSSTIIQIASKRSANVPSKYGMIFQLTVKFQLSQGRST